MKNIVKIAIISMSMFLVGCGEAGAKGPIFLSFYGIGTNTLDVTDAETTCAYYVCSLSVTETVTIDGQTLPSYIETDGNIEYTYTYTTGEDADDDGELDEATVTSDFTVTANAGADANGFDDGAAGAYKICAVAIMCFSSTGCTEQLTCTDVNGSEICSNVDGVQVCVTD